jgi:acyl-CoA oxidase
LANTILQIAGGTFLSLTYYQKEKAYFTDPLYAAELHALAAAVKSKYTKEVAKTISECRTILGGHGYSALSGFNKLYHSSDVNTTWEGDNTVLLQQTTKFLVKTIGSKQKTKIIDLSFVSN